MSDKIKNGGPAFPHPTECSDGRAIPHLGMTLRAYFAAKAMEGILAGRRIPLDDMEPALLAKDAIAIADAMLAARNGGAA